MLVAEHERRGNAIVDRLEVELVRRIRAGEEVAVVCREEARRAVAELAALERAVAPTLRAAVAQSRAHYINGVSE